jgi:hypothetical protein
MNLIPIPRWIVDELFLNPRIHGILQNIIRVLTLHPQPSPTEGCKHCGKKIHAIAIQVIINHYLVLLMVL